MGEGGCRAGHPICSGLLGQGAQTVVVLALLQGLAEALAQGQVALGGGAVQELPDLIGAGPRLQGLRGSTRWGLGHSTRGSWVSSGWAPRRGLRSWGWRPPLRRPPALMPQGSLAGSVPQVSVAPSLKQGEPTVLSKPLPLLQWCGNQSRWGVGLEKPRALLL